MFQSWQETPDLSSTVPASTQKSDKSKLSSLLPPHLQSSAVPAGPVIESPRAVEEKHDGDEGVEDHGENQGDEVEQGDVDGEHDEVHGRVSRKAEGAFRDLNER